MSNMSGAFIGSSVGAAVGCLAWIGVGWATGYELGILAVGVGIAVGIGAAAGAKGRAGTSGAIVAALVAIASIVVARYVLLQMAIEKDIAAARAEFGADIPGPENAEYWTSYIADRIVREREQAGQTIDWPYVDDDQEDNLAAQYPAEIWMEAQKSWARIPAAQRPEFCAAATQSILTGDEEAYRTVMSIIGVLLTNLHPMALIIMGIAAVGAFRIARNSQPVEGAEGESMLDGDPAAANTFAGGMQNPAALAGLLRDSQHAAAPAPPAATMPGHGAIDASRAIPSTPAPQTMFAPAPQTKYAPAAPAIPAPAPKPAPAAVPAKPSRTTLPPFDESQLPPQFRLKQPPPSSSNDRFGA